MHDSPRHSGKKAKGRRARFIEPFSVDEPRYFLGQVAYAAGISSNLLKAWISRKVVPMGKHDREAHGKGSSRLLTLRRALAIGLTAEMIKLGISASFAGAISESAIDEALKISAGNPPLDFLISIYPTADFPLFEVVLWNSTIKTLFGRHAPPKVSKDKFFSSVMLVSVERVSERIVRRLDKLA